MATTRPPQTSDRARRVLLAGFLVLVAAVLVTRILAVGTSTAQALAATTTSPAASTADHPTAAGRRPSRPPRLRSRRRSRPRPRPS